MFIHNNVTYYSLPFLLDYPEDISEKEGIYYWVHYPDFNPDTFLFEEIRIILERYSKTNISLSETSEQFKFKVEVGESSFPSNNRLFGLSQEKEGNLILFLKTDKKNVKIFRDFFKDACLRRPFYVGKAINLRNRLKQHFTGKSDLIKILSDKSIKLNNIWIGYQEITLTSEENLSNVFEEILQRIVKPGLTQRPG